MKRYADIKRHAAECNLRAGDVVLMRKRKSFKGGTLWHRDPAIVLEQRHNAVIVQRADGYMTMRNCGEFRRAAPGSCMKWNGNDMPLGKESQENFTSETNQRQGPGHSAPAEVTTPLPSMEATDTVAANPPQGEAGTSMDESNTYEGASVRNRHLGQGLRKHPKQTMFYGQYLDC